ncbi:hypothetical protein IscW_ISCW002254 [Ixodes scapularis]|uniref:Uncharacterized protein n=1 Tax=Ixodes scapularis TaxID=6945 RepID=B7PDM6_IXOSC|nr:hypothetical protein IscW_ISCW002254 [Ixodes scapularis]|eukprot:XP_002410962.1 hypothetical protein IscW_ISCW002254 [Ixodes scapularis]
MNVEKLFILLCLYGKVMRIKFLKSKNGCAMVLMDDPPGPAESIGTPEQRGVFLHQDAARELEGQLHVIRERLVRVPELHPGAGELSAVLVSHSSLNGQCGRPSAPWHNRPYSSGT